MRELPVPSLFDPSVPMPPVAMPDESILPDEKRSERLAKDFIKWCFSFGAGFRNSPDILNLHTWMAKTSLKLKGAEENELLTEARRLYLKRIEQMMKKADAPATAAPLLVQEG